MGDITKIPILKNFTSASDLHYPHGRYKITLIANTSVAQSLYYSLDGKNSWIELNNTFFKEQTVIVDAGKEGLWVDDQSVDQGFDVIIHEVGYATNPFYKLIEEKANFAPTLQAYGGSPTFALGRYIRMGSLVFISIAVSFDANAEADPFVVTNLPFTVIDSATASLFGAHSVYNGSPEGLNLLFNKGAKTCGLTDDGTNVITYADLSGLSIKLNGFYEID
jgi:hypothetical protein